MNTVPQSLKSVSQDAQRTRWCLSLRSRSGDINQSPWSKVRRPGRASCVKRSDRVTLMPFSSQEQFLEKIKVTDMLARMQHQEPVIQRVTAGATRCGVVDKVVESLCLQRPIHTREQQPIHMIQKTDEFTDAVQGEGCGCARCDAITVTADTLRSRLQFLNRVDDVQVVLTMKALVGALSATVVQGTECECDIFGKRQVSRARYRRSKSKGKGKWKSKGRKGFQSGRPADSLEFEEESWDETNETEQEKWWNSWTEGAEPKRDGAPIRAFMVGGTELELNSFKTASAARWSQMLASRACHGCSQASDLSRQGAGQRQSSHLVFQWRFDPLLELTHQKLDFKSNDEGHKASTIRRAHQVV